MSGGGGRVAHVGQGLHRSSWRRPFSNTRIHVRRRHLVAASSRTPRSQRHRYALQQTNRDGEWILLLLPSGVGALFVNLTAIQYAVVTSMKGVRDVQPDRNAALNVWRCKIRCSL